LTYTGVPISVNGITANGAFDGSTKVILSALNIDNGGSLTIEGFSGIKQ
jgi:hypothetical protein